MNFNQAPSHPDEILRLIARTPSGREVLTAFLPLHRSGQVRFQPYAQALLTKLRAALGEGQPVGACFVNDGITGSIHFDPDAPIGVLAPFLVHEMVHALDTSLWLAAGKRQTKKARDQMMLNAETQAFAIQHRFVQELRAADSAFDVFLREQQARVRVLCEKLTQNDISELYGLAQ